MAALALSLYPLLLELRLGGHRIPWIGSRALADDPPTPALSTVWTLGIRPGP